MGLNVDLCHMLGAPSEVECPRCRRVVNNYWDDYDIECGHPNPSPGVWSLAMHCSECEHEWRVEYRVTLGLKEGAKVIAENLDKEVKELLPDLEAVGDAYARAFEALLNLVEVGAT